MCDTASPSLPLLLPRRPDKRASETNAGSGNVRTEARKTLKLVGWQRLGGNRRLHPLGY